MEIVTVDKRKVSWLNNSIRYNKSMLLLSFRQRKPYIYSGVSKRSVSGSNESPEKQFYIDHHKASRHQLYDTIVKYLIA